MYEASGCVICKKIEEIECVFDFDYVELILNIINFIKINLIKINLEIK